MGGVTFRMGHKRVCTLCNNRRTKGSMLLRAVVNALEPRTNALGLFNGVSCRGRHHQVKFMPRGPIAVNSLSPTSVLHCFSSIFKAARVRVLSVLRLGLGRGGTMQQLPLSARHLIGLTITLLKGPSVVVLSSPFSKLSGKRYRRLLSILGCLRRVGRAALLVSKRSCALLSQLTSGCNIVTSNGLLYRLATKRLGRDYRQYVGVEAPRLRQTVAVLDRRFPSFRILNRSLVEVFRYGRRSKRVGALLIRSKVRMSRV